MPNSQTSYNYCALPLASYASCPDESLGRLYPEPESHHRTCFQRDRDRIIHCGAFRRLKSKTQVFVYHEGDHYRTRLTHTLEVAQIARTMARALLVNEDLAESIALAHDLGHTPFAHAGEETLDRCMVETCGMGFDHNEQSLRVLTILEQKYPEWDGLNLTWESLEGIAKHNGPLIKEGEMDGGLDIPDTITMIQKDKDLRLDSYASLEAQIAALADDIAYNCHDTEDGLKAGLFTLDDIAVLPMQKRVLDRIKGKYPDLSESMLIYQMVREMYGVLVEDVLEETRKNLEALKPDSPNSIRYSKKQTVSFSSDIWDELSQLRTFLFERMYRHYTLNRIWLKVEHIVGDLYRAFFGNYLLLPDKWQSVIEENGGDQNDKQACRIRARAVADYIAGMTDAYAMLEHERLFNLNV